MSELDLGTKKLRARTAVYGAVSRGELERKTCEWMERDDEGGAIGQCGDPATMGHHESYDRPLDVTWLCAKHHSARHREINAGLHTSDTGAISLRQLREHAREIRQVSAVYLTEGKEGRRLLGFWVPAEQ